MNVLENTEYFGNLDMMQQQPDLIGIMEFK